MNGASSTKVNMAAVVNNNTKSQQQEQQQQQQHPRRCLSVACVVVLLSVASITVSIGVVLSVTLTSAQSAADEFASTFSLSTVSAGSAKVGEFVATPHKRWTGLQYLVAANILPDVTTAANSANATYHWELLAQYRDYFRGALYDIDFWMLFIALGFTDGSYASCEAQDRQANLSMCILVDPLNASARAVNRSYITNFYNQHRPTISAATGEASGSGQLTTYNPTRRGWYVKAPKAFGLGPFFSNVYIDFLLNIPIVDLNSPIYDDSGSRMIGVTSFTLDLRFMSVFLSALVVTRNTLAVLVDNDGYLLGSSNRAALWWQEDFSVTAAQPEPRVGCEFLYLRTDRVICRFNAQNFNASLALNGLWAKRPDMILTTKPPICSNASSAYSLCSATTGAATATTTTTTTTGVMQGKIADLEGAGKNHYVTTAPILIPGASSTTKALNLHWRFVNLIPELDILHAIINGRNLAAGLAALVVVVSCVSCGVLLYIILIRPLRVIALQMESAASFRDDVLQQEEEDSLSDHSMSDQKNSKKKKGRRPMSRLEEVRTIQDSFYRMCAQLQKAKSFLPETLIAQLNEDYEDEENEMNNNDEEGSVHYTSTSRGALTATADDGAGGGGGSDDSDSDDSHLGGDSDCRYDDNERGACCSSSATSSTAEFSSSGLRPHHNTNTIDGSSSCEQQQQHDENNNNAKKTKNHRRHRRGGASKSKKRSPSRCSSKNGGGGGANDAQTNKSAGSNHSHASVTPKVLQPTSPADLLAPVATMRNVSVVTVNMISFHATLFGGPGSAHSQKVLSERMYGAFVDTARNTAKELRGVIDSFHGDRVVLTFNAVRPCGGYASAAVLTALQLRELLAVPISCGVATGPALVGNLGSNTQKRFGTIGPVYSQSAILERLAKRYVTLCSTSGSGNSSSSFTSSCYSPSGNGSCSNNNGHKLNGGGGCVLPNILLSAATATDAESVCHVLRMDVFTMPSTSPKQYTSNNTQQQQQQQQQQHLSPYSSSEPPPPCTAPMYVSAAMCVKRTAGDEWMYELAAAQTQFPFAKINHIFELAMEDRATEATALSDFLLVHRQQHQQEEEENNKAVVEMAATTTTTTTTTIKNATSIKKENGMNRMDNGSSSSMPPHILLSNHLFSPTTPPDENNTTSSRQHYILSSGPSPSPHHHHHVKIGDVEEKGNNNNNNNNNNQKDADYVQSIHHSHNTCMKDKTSSSSPSRQHQGQHRGAILCALDTLTRWTRSSSNHDNKINDENIFINNNNNKIRKGSNTSNTVISTSSNNHTCIWMTVPSVCQLGEFFSLCVLPSPPLNGSDDQKQPFSGFLK